MSIIWGCVDLSGTALSPQLSGKMESSARRYKIDRFHEICRQNAVMGCGLQMIADYSLHEVLPVYDAETGLLFAADCILDNRTELLRLLGIENREAPDGTLLYQAYRKWGPECHDYLRGSYAFAVYDFIKNTLFISTDHTFSRSLYYLRRGPKIYFSTLIRSIATAAEPTPEPNKRWITDYLAIDSLAILTEPYETAYEGILKPGVAEWILFSTEDEKHHVFWNPLELPPLNPDSDEGYRRQFLEIMDSAAREIVQTGAPVGIYLSSGLDSSAVASCIAPILAEQGRDLRSYTSVPAADYQSSYARNVIVNEQAGVEALVKMYPNIKASFCSLPGVDNITGAQDITFYQEMPVKSLFNNIWMLELGGQARRDGVRIMLNGQIGNLTISWGEYRTVVHTYLHKGRLLQALREINNAGKHHRFSRKKLLIGALRDLWRTAPVAAPTLSAFVNKEAADAFHCKARMQNIAYLRSTGVVTHADIKRLLYNPCMLSLCGEAETKLGLACGFVERDITKDKRVFEFCMRAPAQCFSKDGVERRLVRDYCGDRLPREIIGNEYGMGLQSADWCERLQGRWESVSVDIRRNCLHTDMEPYIDLEEVTHALERVYAGSGENDESELQALFYLYSLSLFLQSFPAGQL